MWIRSQDRQKLIDGKFLCIRPNIGYKENLYNIMSDDILLGTYTGMSRACEILNDIEKKINDMYFYQIMGNTTGETLINWIYHMPLN